MASRSWNRVELIGNLTRDPELRYTPNGAAVVTFGIATNRTFVSEGERKEEVDFHKLVAWNKLAELCNQLLKKGNRVFVSGRLQTRSWAAQDGTQRQTTEIVLEDMILLTPKNGDWAGAGAASEVAAVGEAEEKTIKAKEESSAGVKESKESEESEVEEKAEPEEKSKEVSEAEEPAADKTAPQEEVKDDLPF